MENLLPPPTEVGGNESVAPDFSRGVMVRRTKANSVAVPNTANPQTVVLAVRYRAERIQPVAITLPAKRRKETRSHSVSDRRAMPDASRPTNARKKANKAR